MADRVLRIKVLGNATGVSRMFGSIESSASRAGRVMGGVAAGVRNVFAAGVVIGSAASAAGLSFAQAASDLTEAQNKLDVTLDDLAASTALKEFAEDAVHNFGLSETAATTAAANFAALLKEPLGGDTGEIAKQAEFLTGLVGDLASFHNTTTSMAERALFSGLIGEIEPMRRFQVFLDAISVAEEAVRLGLAETTGEVSEQAKVLARLSLITQKTGDAQNDYLRTADKFANSQRTMTESWINFKAEVGESLAPIFADVFQSVSANLPAAAEMITDFIETADFSGVQRAFDVFRNLSGVGFNFAGGLLGFDMDSIAGDFGNEVRDRIEQPIRNVIGFVEDNWGTIETVIDDVLRGAEGTFTWAKDELFEPFLEAAGNVVGYFEDNWDTITTEVEKMAEPIGEVFSSVRDDVLEPFIGFLTGEEFAGVVSTTADNVGEILGHIDGLASGTSLLLDIVTGDWGAAKKTIAEDSDSISSSIAGITTLAVTMSNPLIQFAGSIFGVDPEEEVEKFFNAIFHEIEELTALTPQQVASALANFGIGLSESIWQGIQTGINVISALNPVAGMIIDAVGFGGRVLWNYGVGVAQSLWDGFESWFPTITGWINTALQSIGLGGVGDAFWDKFGNTTPSFLPGGSGGQGQAWGGIGGLVGPDSSGFSSYQGQNGYGYGPTAMGQAPGSTIVLPNVDAGVIYNAIGTVSPAGYYDPSSSKAYW